MARLGGRGRGPDGRGQLRPRRPGRRLPDGRVLGVDGLLPSGSLKIGDVLQVGTKVWTVLEKDGDTFTLRDRAGQVKRLRAGGPVQLLRTSAGPAPERPGPGAERDRMPTPGADMRDFLGGPDQDGLSPFASGLAEEARSVARRLFGKDDPDEERG